MGKAINEAAGALEKQIADLQQQVSQLTSKKMLLQSGTLSLGPGWNSATVKFPIPYLSTPMFSIFQNSQYRSEENCGFTSVTATEAKVFAYGSTSTAQRYIWQAYGEVSNANGGLKK